MILCEIARPPARRGRSALATLAIAAGTFTGAGNATAATVTKDDDFGEVLVNAADGEANLLTVTPLAGRPGLSIRDDGTPLIAGRGCTGGGAVGVAVECPGPADGGGPEQGPFLLVRVRDGDDLVDTSATPARVLPQTEIRTGEGADRVETAAALDDIYPGPGADFVSTGGFEDRVAAAGASEAEGADVLIGGKGTDRVSYEGRTGRVVISADGEANDGAAGEGDQLIGFEELEGGAGGDIVRGGPDDDILYGGAGSDEVSGLGGGDELYDGGRFTFERASADLLLGGEGRDLLSAFTGTNILRAGPGGGFAFGGTGEDLIVGGSGNDVISGEAGKDRIRGRSGRDRLAGSAGDDRISAGPGDDAVRGGLDNDRLFGGNGSDTIDSAYRFVGEALTRVAERARDRVDCGASHDEAIASPVDELRDCESVERSRR